MIPGELRVLLGEFFIVRSFGIFLWALLFFINNDIYLSVSQEPGLIRRSRTLTHKYENHSTKLSGWK